MVIALIAVSLGGCATATLPPLPPPTSTQSIDIARYRFVVIEATPAVSSIAARNGDLYTQEINPANLIEGLLLKKGLVRVATVASDSQEQTLILRWGISGRRDINYGGIYKYFYNSGSVPEVTMLLQDAHSKQSAYKCSAEGLGKTDADDIQMAITSCLSGLK